MGRICIFDVHTDDFLIAHSMSLFNPRPLHDAFSWGRMVQAPEPITLAGKHLAVFDEYVEVCQSERLRKGQ